MMFSNEKELRHGLISGAMMSIMTGLGGEDKLFIFCSLWYKATNSRNSGNRVLFLNMQHKEKEQRQRGERCLCSTLYLVKKKGKIDYEELSSLSSSLIV